MAANELYLAWEDPIDHKWLPVGRLTIDENSIYRFVYTKGAQSSRNFVPLVRMGKFDEVYTSDTLFPLFSNRLLLNSRPESRNYMEWLDIKENECDPLTMLAITEGIRGTDTFEVFQCPEPNDEGKYEVKFFSHGLRYLPIHAIERVNSLQKGDKLFILPDIQNKHDEMALALRMDDPVEMAGYCPRYLSPDFYELLKRTGTPDDIEVSVERVNVKAPLQLRLLCKIVAPWPEGFQPCSEDKFKPLVEYDYGLQPLPGSPPRGLSNTNGYDVSGNNSKKSSGMADCLPKEQVPGISENPMKNSRYSRRQAHKVVRQLKGRGAKASMSPASKGAADLKALFPSEKSWNAQTKSSRSGTPTSSLVKLRTPKN